MNDKLFVPFHSTDNELDWSPERATLSVDREDFLLKFRPSDLAVRSVVTTTDTQTLTNKTLTAPVINGAVSAPASVVNPTEVAIVADILTAADSGKTFFLNAATEFALTLPAVAAGLNFKFIVTAAPSGANYTIVTPSAVEIIVGKVFSAAGDAGDVENTAGATTISFVSAASVIGDRVELECDGTLWYAVAFASVAAGITYTG